MLFLLVIIAMFAVAIACSARARRLKKVAATTTPIPMSCLTCRGLTYTPHHHTSALTGREVTRWTDHVGEPISLSQLAGVR